MSLTSAAPASSRAASSRKAARSACRTVCSCSRARSSACPACRPIVHSRSISATSRPSRASGSSRLSSSSGPPCPSPRISTPSRRLSAVTGTITSARQARGRHRVRDAGLGGPQPPVQRHRPHALRQLQRQLPARRLPECRQQVPGQAHRTHRSQAGEPARALRLLVDQHQGRPARVQRGPAALHDHGRDVLRRGRGREVGHHLLHDAGSGLRFLGGPLGRQQLALVPAPGRRLEQRRPHEHGRPGLVAQLHGVDQAREHRAVGPQHVERHLPHRALHAQQRRQVGVVEDLAADREQIPEARAEDVVGRPAGPGAEGAVDLDDPAVGQRGEVAHRRVLVEIGRVLLEQPVQRPRRVDAGGIGTRAAHGERNARMAAVVSSGALRLGQ